MAKIVLSAVTYIVIVFPLAYGWHIGLFKEKYAYFGYFSGEPNIPVGLLSMVVQGVALAVIYPLFQTGSTGFTRAFQFAALMGLFFWTSHVLALVAKQQVPDAGSFILMESGFLALQFGFFAVALGLIYRSVE